MGVEVPLEGRRPKLLTSTHVGIPFSVCTMKLFEEEGVAGSRGRVLVIPPSALENSVNNQDRKELDSQFCQKKNDSIYRPELRSGCKNPILPT